MRKEGKILLCINKASTSCLSCGHAELLLSPLEQIQYEDTKTANKFEVFVSITYQDAKALKLSSFHFILTMDQMTMCTTCERGRA